MMPLYDRVVLANVHTLHRALVVMHCKEGIVV